MPSGKNLFNYVNYHDSFKLLQLFFNQKGFKFSPTFWWVDAQQEATNSVTKVRCEHVFGVSGYVSSPRRSRLQIRTYERIAMLIVILSKVYIDDAWVDGK